MSLIYILGAVFSAAVLVYLVVALLVPEKF
jgi:K+-transporting ATPase KdpF subunit